MKPGPRMDAGWGRAGQLFAVALFVTLLPTGAAGAGAADGEVPATIVLVPFANHTERSDAAGAFLPHIVERLEAEGYRVIHGEDLRPILREHRIRASGLIDRAAADLLREAFGCRWFLTGAVELYDPDLLGEMALSMRLLDAASLSVLWAAGAASSLQEHEGFFGYRGVRGEPELARQVVKELFADWPPSGAPHGTRLAVVPFDNHTSHPHAGDIVADLLRVELVTRGYDVAEPGVVEEATLAIGRQLRGGVDMESLAQLVGALDLAYVIAGSVDRFEAAGQGPNANPVLEFGARLVDARSGRLLFSHDRLAEGTASETLFGRGRCFSVGQLAQRTSEDFVKAVERKEDVSLTTGAK